MDKTVRIITYHEKFQSQILELILHIQQMEFGVAVTAADQPDLMTIRDFYQVDAGNFWLAVTGEEVVGTIALKEFEKGKGALRKMFVKTAYRGREAGTGQQLLNELLTWAKEHGFTGIWLGTTEHFLAAHRFYAKNGFVELLPENLPLKYPRMKVDTKFYQYTLNA